MRKELLLIRKMRSQGRLFRTLDRTRAGLGPGLDPFEIDLFSYESALVLEYALLNLYLGNADERKPLIFGAETGRIRSQRSEFRHSSIGDTGFSFSLTPCLGVEFCTFFVVAMYLRIQRQKFCEEWLDSAPCQSPAIA